jgi:acyl-coenzyme A synthetase/AMP-(fatty) acid ligase/acyl carrier protein
MIGHGSLVNYIDGACTQFELKPDDRILQFASISFDAAAEEIYPCLIRGAALHLRNDMMVSSVPHFLEVCSRLDITVLNFPTAFWHQIVSDLADHNLHLPESVRLVIIGGERVLPERVADWQTHIGQKIRLINTYGPTEATIVATSFDLTNTVIEDVRQEVPIGRPATNVRTYVLDKALQPVPVGVAGELHIGGDGLARGYLNRPELTAEKFIPDPFSDDKGARLYKTGDLVRYLSDGNLEFLGRIDHQVKVRGYRIELGEIEAVLGQHPGVREVIVQAREDIPGDKRLVAYLVLEKDCGPTTTELRSFLKERLPDYMVPAIFVVLDEFPLMPNGKVDRQALPEPETVRPDIEASYAAPRSQTEKMLADVWAEVLNVEQVGINDNFFDLGGHSLLMTQVHRKLQEIIGQDISMITLFQYPTIGSLSNYLSGNGIDQSSFERIYDRAERQEKAMAMQKRMQAARRRFNG